MAVVQISKIQIRRGQKNQGTGIPQLASGEFGWAVDTQELFIGNGAVSEGAPAVGNTQILTNESNIFELADEYSYNSDLGYIETGLLANTTRTLQNKLDDFASAADFGMTGVSTQDATELLQNALDQLYLNSQSKGTESSRVVLYMPAGVYTITDTVYLPPHTSLVGEGIDNTVIRNTGNQASCLVTVNLDSTPGSPADHSTTTAVNQNKNILIRNITLQTQDNNVILQMDSSKNCIFENVKFLGAWSNTDGILSTNAAVVLNNLSATITSTENTFTNCQFYSCSHGVYSDWDVTYNHWQNCAFYDLGLGFAFASGVGTLDISAASGIQTGPSFNRIENSKFLDISRQAVYVKFGTDNISKNNTFDFVGNDHGAEYESAYPILQYDDESNDSLEDYFSRTSVLGVDPTYVANKYYPEVAGQVRHSSRNRAKISISQSSIYTTKFRLPIEATGESQQFVVRYFLKSNAYSMVRSGKLYITVNGVSDSSKLSDEYDYEGDADKETDILFASAVTDVAGVKHVNVTAKSSMPGDDQTDLVYSVEILK